MKCVARETAKDTNMHNVIVYLQQGRPEGTTQVHEIVSNLFRKRHELSIEKGCLFWGFIIGIPENLQGEFLSELHASHMGTTKMKQVPGNNFWWTNLNDDPGQISVPVRCV